MTFGQKTRDYIALMGSLHPIHIQHLKTWAIALFSPSPQFKIFPPLQFDKFAKLEYDVDNKSVVLTINHDIEVVNFDRAVLCYIEWCRELMGVDWQIDVLKGVLDV